MKFDIHITKGKYGNIVALESLDLSVQTGECVGILGANGAGKTTALQAVLKTVATEERTIRMGDKDLSKLATWQLAHEGIGFAPDGSWSFDSLTVLDNLRYVYEINSKDIAEKNPQVLLDKVFRIFPRLLERKKQLAGTLSGGERKMLALSRVLMLTPKVMILDEPSSGLAPIMVSELYRAIAAIKAEGDVAIILAEQNAKMCLSVSDRCLLLDLGNVVASGTPEELSQNDEIRRAYFGS